MVLRSFLIPRTIEGLWFNKPNYNLCPYPFHSIVVDGVLRLIRQQGHLSGRFDHLG